MPNSSWTPGFGFLLETTRACRRTKRVNPPWFRALRALGEKGRLTTEPSHDLSSYVAEYILFVFLDTPKVWPRKAPALPLPPQAWHTSLVGFVVSADAPPRVRQKERRA